MVYEIGKVTEHGYTGLRLVSADMKAHFVKTFVRNGYSYKKEFDCEILQRNSTVYVISEYKRQS